MAHTKGIRTWKRISRNESLAVNESIQETTHYPDMERSIREADFITIPRLLMNGGGHDEGYDEQYAEGLAQVLKDRFGYSGQVRTSMSGNSCVFEKTLVVQGASFDFGLGASVSVAIPSPNGIAVH